MRSIAGDEGLALERGGAVAADGAVVGLARAEVAADGVVAGRGRIATNAMPESPLDLRPGCGSRPSATG